MLIIILLLKRKKVSYDEDDALCNEIYRFYKFSDEEKVTSEKNIFKALK